MKKNFNTTKGWLSQRNPRQSRRASILCISYKGGHSFSPAECCSERLFQGMSRERRKPAQGSCGSVLY